MLWLAGEQWLHLNVTGWLQQVPTGSPLAQFFFIFLREARNGNFSIKSSDFAMLRPNTKSL